MGNGKKEKVKEKQRYMHKKEKYGKEGEEKVYMGLEKKHERKIVREKEWKTLLDEQKEQKDRK